VIWHEIGWEERLRNDLFCVEWVVKSLAQRHSEDVLSSSGELVGQSETAAGRCNSRSVRSNSRAAGGRSQQRRHPPQNWQVRRSRISVRIFVNVSCEGQSSVSRRVGWLADSNDVTPAVRKPAPQNTKTHSFTFRSTWSISLRKTSSPLPSNRHHRSCGDRLEGKGGNCQVCSVQYCVQQLCTVRCTHI